MNTKSSEDIKKINEQAVHLFEHIKFCLDYFKEEELNRTEFKEYRDRTINTVLMLSEHNKKFEHLYTQETIKKLFNKKYLKRIKQTKSIISKNKNGFI